jgi:regulatory protein
MTLVIRITKLVAHGETFRVEISTLEEPLIVPAEIIFRHALKADIVLTEPQLEQLKAEAELIRCDREAARMLGMREHTIGELRTKLKRKKFSVEAVDQAIKRYRSRGLLDDAHVANKLVRQSLERNPSGRAFLIAMLQRKQVPRPIAEQAVELALGSRDEIELAVISLRKRWSSIGQLELERARTKAYTYLSRRGISYDAARAAFEQLYNHQNEDSEHQDR